MRDATDRGVLLMMTNSDMPQVREIYGDFYFSSIPTRRDIHLTSSLRDSVDLVISNYHKPARAVVRHPEVVLGRPA